MELIIHSREYSDTLKVFIEGEIDTYTAPKLRDKLDSIEVKPEGLIELDLSKVTYMDSTGLGVFVALYKNVTRENGNLKLVGLTAKIKRLFTITGLSELMNVEVGVEVE